MTETVFTQDMTQHDDIRSSDCLSLVLSGVAANEEEARQILEGKVELSAQCEIGEHAECPARQVSGCACQCHREDCRSAILAALASALESLDTAIMFAEDGDHDIAADHLTDAYDSVSATRRTFER